MAENAAQPILEVKSGEAKGKKKASGRANAKAAGAGGSYFLPPQAQVLQPTVQVPRRFPGHFMPHRLCNHWNLQGWCKKAETCTFAHGIDELHPDVQAQLLQQKPGMPPPTVTKDGRLVVHGVTKPAGKVVGGDLPGYSMQTLTNIYTAGQNSVLGPGALPFNGTTSYPFNLTGSAAARLVTSLVPNVDKENEEEPPEQENTSSPGTPTKRHRPAPLSLDDISEGNTQAMMVRPLVSPTVASHYTTICTQPMASPMRVSVVSSSAFTFADLHWFDAHWDDVCVQHGCLCGNGSDLNTEDEHGPYIFDKPSQGDAELHMPHSHGFDLASFSNLGVSKESFDTSAH
mmetsp:Transcript_52785/g.84289  ORF Transcript_52785/g.84289 Transcript_52785/m.84289 type:complete len:344 (+) Transcript_52785:61-1092(+)